MRKLVFTAALTLAAFTANAQTWDMSASWQKTLTPVSDAKELSGIHTSVADNGTVVVTGTFNKAFSFGSSKLANADALTSAFVAKYAADGSELWAVSLYGSSIITAVTTDTEGNVYVAGSYADEVTVGSADGKTQVIKGLTSWGEYVTTKSAGFVAKYDVDGNLKAVREIKPVVDDEINASGIYLDLGDMKFRPTNILVNNGKVYLSATYSGDVKMDNMTWDGSYILGDLGMYIDNTYSAGVLSLSSTDLTMATNVLLARSATVTNTQEGAESLNFTVDGDKVYVTLVGNGQLSLITSDGSKDITLARSTDESSKIEHAFIVVTVGTNTTYHVYHVEAHDKLYGTDRVSAMAASDGKLYIAGTFYNQLGFDVTKTSLGASDIFAACINPNDYSVVWAANNAYNEGDVTAVKEYVNGMTVKSAKVYINGYSLNDKDDNTTPLTYNIADGTMTAGPATLFDAMYQNVNGTAATIVAEDTKITVSTYNETASGISNIANEKADNTSVKFYSVDGKYYGTSYSALPKGVFIGKGNNSTKKFIK